MTQKDFIFLDVGSFIHRKVIPPSRWEETARSLCQTQIDFFRDHGLLEPHATALHCALEKAIVRFSDFTPEGQEFIMTAATDKWLKACDRKQTVEAYKDPSGLVRRLTKFRKLKE